ncbi:NAD(P)H-quinone oxidoreductase [Aquirhabdus parva]|uniref:NAD(P)H-quinone oxidoreductase n=1 Tax=Aquirhabdus parva TaxID=2283318 RepID=A0A345P9Z0_9GAMM|nr:NAD(P)H-quinone oxidoreductase [Aquirhabdus parva]AXI04099.1 NAD(P)H-quinone oxidoreductase [Aquirhabdus parva]
MNNPIQFPNAHLPESMTEISITHPGKPEVLVPHQTAIPVPAADELLIQVFAAGVNRPDVMQRQGIYPMPAGVNPVPGLEISGLVVAKGANVSGFSLGDRVCGLTNGGGYAEYCVLPASQALPIPKGVTFIQAAAIPETFFTVWANLFQIGKAKAGDRVLIHGGSSGIGTTALMLCKELGIESFATVGSAEKCHSIAHLTQPINYREQDFATVVLQQTQQQGVDVILDIVGGSYFAQNLHALARDGRLVIIGFMGGVTAKDVNLQELVLKRAIVTGSTMRARTRAEKAEITQALLEHVWPLLAAGKFLPMIHAAFSLCEVVKAHEMMEAGDHVGKIILTVPHKDVPNP